MRYAAELHRHMLSFWVTKATRWCSGRCMRIVHVQIPGLRWQLERPHGHVPNNISMAYNHRELMLLVLLLHLAYCCLIVIPTSISSSCNSNSASGRCGGNAIHVAITGGVNSGKHNSWSRRQPFFPAPQPCACQARTYALAHGYELHRPWQTRGCGTNVALSYRKWARWIYLRNAVSIRALPSCTCSSTGRRG